MKAKTWILLLACALLVTFVGGVLAACGGPHTVTFLHEGKVYEKVTVKNGGKVTLPPDPSPDGFALDYWAKEDGSPFSPESKIKKDITLTSVVTKGFEIRYLSDEGEEIYREKVKAGGSAKYGAIPVKQADEHFTYTFEKWVTEQGGDEEADLSRIILNRIVYAKFKPQFKETPTQPLVDFTVEVETGREARILQITDTQILETAKKRYPSRVSTSQTLSDEDLYNDCFKYIESAVAQTDPDLILMTGDNVYGEFDDDGNNLKRLIAYMDSLNIPWAPVFGNHDNESTMGVTWQCQQFEQAKNCLFKRGEVTGNGNYSIGIMQGGKMIKAIFMLDTNGCANGYTYSYDPSFGTYNEDEDIKTSVGFNRDQLEWLESSAKMIDLQAGVPVSKFIAFHIPTAEFAYAAEEAGYQKDNQLNNKEYYTIGKDVEAQNGDFGSKGESFACYSQVGLWEILKANHFDGVFVGHAHRNNVSILYEGIRLTFGLKSSVYDSHNPLQLGGTGIYIAEGGTGFRVEHAYYKEN